MPWGVRNLPGLGIKSISLILAGRVLNTGPSRKVNFLVFYVEICISFVKFIMKYVIIFDATVNELGFVNFIFLTFVVSKKKHTIDF